MCLGICAGAAPLSIAFPPDGYRTKAASIFILGSSPPSGLLLIDGQEVRRSPSGYFAPTVALELGVNTVEARCGEESISIRVTRLPLIDMPSGEAAVAPGSIYPEAPQAFMPGEIVDFRLSALPGAEVEVSLGDRSIPLRPRTAAPSESEGEARAEQPLVYEGSMALPSNPGSQEPLCLGSPTFRISRNGSSACYTGEGDIAVLSPECRQTVEIAAERCAARSGPSGASARIITIPKGSRSGVSGYSGDWYRLDCGYWVLKSDAIDLGTGTVLRPRLGDVIASSAADGTTLRFFLSSPAPVGAFQETDRLSLRFYGVETRTELIKLSPDRLVQRALWTESSPGNVVFCIDLAAGRLWGYSLRYEGSTLVLELRSPPAPRRSCFLDPRPLAGMSFVLDPGHGGIDGGAIGPDGRREKDLNLAFALALERELLKRGAEVFMPRDTDVFVSLADRVDFIEKHHPSLALSLHHNSLPDEASPEEVSGFGSFWYNAQAHEAAAFLFERYVAKCKAYPYGVFWDNLALPRTTGAPTVLLELGFMSNPWEFERLIDPQEREKRARYLAEAIVEWSRLVRR
jgi:N-acetylmuramoyl-L-alanine amidase